MNANFALTDIPGRRRPQLSQELRLHLQLAVLPLKFAEPGSVGDRQWWLLADVVQSVLVHPVPESAFVHLNFPGDLGYRPGRLDHHFHGLVLELRCELPAPFSHRSSSVPAGPYWVRYPESGRLAKLFPSVLAGRASARSPATACRRGDVPVVG